MKYPINKEFSPYSRMTPPIQNAKMAGWMGSKMKPPRWVQKNRDCEVSIKKENIKSYDGAEISVVVIDPYGLEEVSPCLVYYHGGGFVLAAAGYHYKNAMQYAKEVGCKVVFVNYRLAPQNPHPVFFEDCYAAMCWTYDHAEALGVDTSRIGIGGDSAGSTLAVGVCMMARDRQHPIKFAFQMLPYPFLDMRNNSESCQKFTDTPMWNSTLSSRIAPMTKVDRNHPNYIYYSPVEAENFEGLPPAYIETAEFDCLHDDGILYAEKLREAGVEVTLIETKGTMHGFDIVQKAQPTKAALAARIAFMKKVFKSDN